MPKISVLLSTNRINKKVFPYMQKCIDGLSELQNDTFTPEFKDLCNNRLNNIKHFIEPTLKSISAQKFKDIEFIISHRYPEDMEEIFNVYEELMDIPIKLVKEKLSIWHELGDNYHTVANNKNTAVIHSKGELIYHIDDLSFFNEHLLEEAWNEYQKGNYITGRTYRCITYNSNLEDKIEEVGPNKTNIIKNGWIGQHKPLTSRKVIPMSAFWTCSASVSAEELLKINGYDELYDGSLTGIDMDAGNRLSKISKYNRVASDNYLYEIDDPTPKNNIRDDVTMRKLWNVNHIKANSWKPKPHLLRRYKRWHEKKIGNLDKNWDKFMDVPLYNLKRIE